MKADKYARDLKVGDRLYHWDGEEYKPEVEMYNGIYQLDLGK